MNRSGYSLRNKATGKLDISLQFKKSKKLTTLGVEFVEKMTESVCSLQKHHSHDTTAS